MVDFCSSNVLWFVNGCVGSNGFAHITSRVVAIEFGVAEECANEELSRLCEADFMRRISPSVYEVTQNGKDECTFLSKFVKRGNVRKINPRTAITIAVKLRAWFPSKSPDEISYELAQITADIFGKKFKCDEGEFELAKKMMS